MRPPELGALAVAGSPATRLDGGRSTPLRQDRKERTATTPPSPTGHTPPDRRASFLASLVQLGEWLDAEQIPYVIFGSVAASAWLDQGASLDFNRPGARHPAESIPDVDLLVPRASLDRVKRYVQAARTGAFPASIDTFWSECWIDFRPDSEFSHLTHRKIRIPVRTELLTAAPAWLLGQQVAVVDPRTLLHLYGTVGVARRKDAPGSPAWPRPSPPEH